VEQGAGSHCTEGPGDIQSGGCFQKLAADLSGWILGGQSCLGRAGLTCQDCPLGPQASPLGTCVVGAALSLGRGSEGD
jgi:hypothetical protein